MCVLGSGFVGTAKVVVGDAYAYAGAGAGVGADRARGCAAAWTWARAWVSQPASRRRWRQRQRRGRKRTASTCVASGGEQCALRNKALSSVGCRVSQVRCSGMGVDSSCPSSAAESGVGRGVQYAPSNANKIDS